MPKKAQHPGLRARIRKGKSGKVWTGYYFCAPGQKSEIPLGTNFEYAVKEWDRLRNHIPSIKGSLAEAFERFERDVLPTKGAANARDYKQHLKMLRLVFDPAGWATVNRPLLQRYLDNRKAKPQGVKEVKLLGYVWEFAKNWGMTQRDNPIRGWRIGTALVREVEVTDEAFDALYAEADQVVRDVMDLMTATGIRLGDVLKVQITDVRGDVLRVRANKTAKVSEFVIAGSVLERLIADRLKRKKDILHFKLLTTEAGKEVTPATLRKRWDKARARAALKLPEVAMLFLRDMRKRAANLSATDDDAARLLQHSNKAITNTHYRTRGERVRPVR